MKNREKPDKFLLPHGMPSDDEIIRIFIEGIPSTLSNHAA
jgi:hypothetical protein